MSIFFNIGVHVILLVLPEMVPTQYKMIVMRLWSLVSQVSMLVYVFIFPMLMKKIDHYVFLLFMVSNLIFILWVQFRHVESKDVPSIEVFKQFENRKYI